ncbi:L,D-transpeptidase [Breoghania sp. L-A4]|uniref:L,D-transpeptidase n=1 Tax=Breoghania sp. L-A4 TaxID=2304600 RepID=UPI000E358DD8|nr:L,D-transpeptidase [Breoghania sp. L-A4]AXS39407.1 L,D-transpeptidase [Breoghania sp. L-A4]
MNRSFSALLAAVCLAAAATPVTAFAESSFRAPPPPLVLSPDLTGPWVMKLDTSRRTPRVSLPAPRGFRHAALPGDTRAERPRAAQQKSKSPPPMDPAFLPTVVDYRGGQAPGTVIIDTPARYLYLVESGGKARRYGVGVGRPGFEWAGTHTVTRKAEWPDWRPPAEMRQRQPGLPAFMPGGPSNPLGARAMYLGSTLYRIHGSNQPWSIGRAVSSGCIRMRNEDAIDLYARVQVGTKVIVQ